MNSLRLGLVHEDNIYGKPTIFLAMGSQSPEVKERMSYYNDLLAENQHYIIAIPFDNNGTEPGDDYEIVAYYENILGFKSYVVEKIDVTHKFFKDFGVPVNDFTEYHFDAKTRFVRKV